MWLKTKIPLHIIKIYLQVLLWKCITVCVKNLLAYLNS
jgi:hypothetical protein